MGTGRSFCGVWATTTVANEPRIPMATKWAKPEAKLCVDVFKDPPGTLRGLAMIDPYCYRFVVICKVTEVMPGSGEPRQRPLACSSWRIPGRTKTRQPAPRRPCGSAVVARNRVDPA